MNPCLWCGAREGQKHKEDCLIMLGMAEAGTFMMKDVFRIDKEKEKTMIETKKYPSDMEKLTRHNSELRTLLESIRKVETELHSRTYYLEQILLNEDGKSIQEECYFPTVGDELAQHHIKGKYYTLSRQYALLARMIGMYIPSLTVAMLKNTRLSNGSGDIWEEHELQEIVDTWRECRQHYADRHLCKPPQENEDQTPS